MTLLERLQNGRTDLVFELIASGEPASLSDDHDVSLLQHCAYFGDVSAMKFLISNGAPLASLGANLDLNGASFHGHWRLCQFLMEHGADPNYPLDDTAETPLHAALCTADRPSHNMVVKLLLAEGANPNAVTKASAETGGFMRDVRTRMETPLHRAAAFGDEEVIQMLLEAGARVEAKDMNGDSPLTWASWHLRPAHILRLLCYGGYRIRPDYAGMRANLLGTPDTKPDEA